MSKWLKSTTNMTYTAQGKVIPAGKNEPLQVSDAEADKILKMPVIASLVKNGAITVLDKYTSNNPLANSQAKLASLTQENAELAQKNKELESQLAAMRNGASTQDGELKLKLVAAEEALRAKEEQFNELKAEAEAKIAELQAELEKAQAKAAKKSGSSKKDEE